jgi:hypothetical protein
MDEIEEFKNFFGPLANGYNEAELRQLRYEMHAMAELLLDIYLDKRRSDKPKKSTSAHFDTPEKES